MQAVADADIPDPGDSASVDVALMASRTIAGVDRRLFNLNIAFAVIIVFVLQFWKLAIVNVLMHFVLIWVTAQHPDVIASYMRYRKQGDLYRPWVSLKGWKRNRRPEGFGRI